MTPAQKIRIQGIGVLLLALISGIFAIPNGPNWLRDEVKLHLGLDLAGGAHLVYEADTTDIPGDARESAVEGTRDVIERRVNAFGVGEPVVQTNKSDTGYRIIVELPGVSDIKEAIKKIGDTPVLEFKEKADPVPLTEEEKQDRRHRNAAKKVRAELVLKEMLVATNDEFAKKASQVSDDPDTKSRGGDLGFVRKGQFMPEFEKILFDTLKDGQTYSEVVETEFGYHIIRRTESRCKNTISDEVVSCDLLTDSESNSVELNQKNIQDGKLTVDLPASSGVIEEVRGSHILFMTLPEDVRVPDEFWKNTQLSGEYLSKARVQFNRQTGMPIVSIEFNKEGGDLFEEITARNVNKQVAIFLDGSIISAPRVQQKISGGNAVITGDFSVVEAQDLAKRLNAGALPVPIILISQQQVGAQLGALSVQKSFLAGVLGLFFVILFMIFYYRLPGLVASVALIIYSLIILTLFKLIPVVLTLSGVAGFILTIGLAVDANVLIFERIKEELRTGKTLQAAIDEGFSRAWTSIRDSNISTLITAFILMWMGESLIKGFGITLGIGVLVSMFSAITITRVLLKLVAKQGTDGNWLWGR